MFIEEIANRLINQNVGLTASSIFFGSKAPLPAGDGPYITLTETGGTGAARMHNSSTERPTLQIYTRAKSAKTARAVARAAYDALGGPDGLYNLTLDGVTYVKIVARQEPTDVGADDIGRVCYSFNIDAEKQRS